MRLELANLTADTAELTFDYSITGFDTTEIDQILGGDASLGKPDPADEVPTAAASEAPVTNTGDLWVCGNHHLYCGNALEAASYRALLGGDPVQIVFTDPPYNVHVAGHVSKRADVREFAMASGDLNSEEFITFLQTTSAHIAANVVDGAVIYVCMDWRHLDDLSRPPPDRLFREAKKTWWCGSEQTGARARSIVPNTNTSRCMWYGNASPTNNFRLGERGRYRTNVWSYPGFNTIRTGPRLLLSVFTPP